MCTTITCNLKLALMNLKSRKNYDKKKSVGKTPNVSKMQEVIIDGKTRIYIDIDADPELARSRYLARQSAR